MYADDVVFFFKPIHASHNTVNQILHQFYNMAGHEINGSKSTIVFSPNTPRLLKHSFAASLNMKFSNNLWKYLRAYINSHANKAKNYTKLIDRIIGRLNGWHPQIRIAKKETLIKFVI